MATVNKLKHYLKLVESWLKPASNLFKVTISTPPRIGVQHLQTGAEWYFKKLQKSLLKGLQMLCQILLYTPLLYKLKPG